MTNADIIRLDERYNIAVCTECCVALPFEWISSHIKNAHGAKRSVNEILLLLHTDMPSMTVGEVKEFLAVNWILDRAVEGVAVEKGYYCRLCHYCVKCPDAMKNHGRGHSEWKWSESIMECNMQRLFTSWLEKYVRIEEPEEWETALEVEDWKVNLTEEFDRFMHKQSITDNTSPDLRLKNAFIAKIRWDLAVAGVDGKKLVELAAIPTIKDSLHEYRCASCAAYPPGISIPFQQ